VCYYFPTSLSPDPAGAGWNSYAYSSNPNSSIDLTGLKTIPRGDTGGGGLYLGFAALNATMAEMAALEQGFDDWINSTFYSVPANSSGNNMGPVRRDEMGFALSTPGAP
jgi:uncharacterized protein RhaS with RHS repeats